MSRLTQTILFTLTLGLFAWSQGPAGGFPGNFHVEPGTHEIPVKGGGTVQGKVWIDLETGDAWGFPVQGTLHPYPGLRVAERTPLTVAPIYLGRFDISQTRRGFPRR
jgi:hypothetical protein